MVVTFDRTPFQEFNPRPVRWLFEAAETANAFNSAALEGHRTNKMSSNPHANSQNQLSWQIPAEEGSKLRAKTLQFAFAGLICLGVLLLFGSRSFRIAALVGSIPFALFVVWRSRRNSRGPTCTGDNVRLDEEGLHWRDAGGTERRIARDQIEGFRIGLDPDTFRALPALTLLLAGGFESQPVELHAPIGPTHVRRFMVDQLHVDESQQDERYAAQLHDALAAACVGGSDLPEMRVLRFGLVEPKQLDDGSWLVARLIEGHQVEFLPDSCRYRCRHESATAEMDDVTQLGAYVRSEILARRENEPGEWLTALDCQQVQRDQLALRGDAAQLGFYVECDLYGNLHIEGSRGGILRLCQKIEDAAQCLQAAPFGARPAGLSVGGDEVRFQVMLDESPWHDEITIAGPRSYLRAVAEAIRTRVQDESFADLLVDVKHGEFASQIFAVHLRGDDYDPLAGFAAKPDSHAALRDC